MTNKPDRFGSMVHRQKNQATKNFGNEHKGDIMRERWSAFKRTFWQRRR